jgi:hypothetical protein
MSDSRISRWSLLLSSAALLVSLLALAVAMGGDHVRNWLVHDFLPTIGIRHRPPTEVKLPAAKVWQRAYVQGEIGTERPL